jgi:hypothetical protein
MQISRTILLSAALLLHRGLEHPSLEAGAKDQESACESGSGMNLSVNHKAQAICTALDASART